LFLIAWAGEFIPTLEEGDFAVEVRLAQGTSLSGTIETYTKARTNFKTKNTRNKDSGNPYWYG